MGDGYDQATATFISWLKKLGVQLNPKASLVDSRSEGRGRCMGTFLPLLSLHILHSSESCTWLLGP